MKILIVNKFLYPNGGSETYIFQLGNELEGRGCRVSFFGMEHEGRIVGNDAGIYTLNMDFHTGKLKKLTYPLRIIYSKEAYRKMYVLMDEFKPDVVHLNNFNFQLTPSVIYAVRDWEKKNNTRVKIIYTAHDYQWICPDHMLQIPQKKELCFKCKGGRFWQCTKNRCIHASLIKSMLGTIEAGYYLRKKAYDMVDAIICPSEFLKEKLETYPLWNSKGKGSDDKHPGIVMMHNFMTSAMTDKTGDVTKGDFILYFGRYSEEKGVKTLLDVCRDLPDIEFRFAGNGPLRPDVESLDNVTNLGFLQGEKLINTIKSAKFVIFPSEWYENCPYSVMEAVSFGTPVIASDIGGVPELLKDGVTGELFKPGDRDDLKKHIEDLINDDDKLQKYAQNCKETRYPDVKGYVEEYLELIERL